MSGSSGGATQAARIDASRGGGGALLAAFSLDGANPAAGATAAAWEHPIDAHFSAGDVGGWPQLAVTVWAADVFGRADVVGYGAARVPTTPGEHLLEIATWRPEGNFLQELRASFVGSGLPQLTDDRTVTDPFAVPRHALTTTTTAAVAVQLSVLHRGFAEQGVVMM